MRLKLPRWTFVALVLLTNVTVDSALSEDSLADLQKHVEALKANSVDANSRSGKKTLERARSNAIGVDQTLDALKSQNPPRQKPTPRPRTHVRSKSGVGFPKYEELVLAPVPTPAAVAHVERKRWTPPEYKRPGRCQDDATRRIESRVGDVSKEEVVLYDVLYLPEDYVPMDPIEVFGERTRLVPYAPIIEDGTLMMMKMDNVPCLPFRTRITTSAIYYDTGKNAYKNYSKKASSRGEYHPFMRKKLFGTK